MGLTWGEAEIATLTIIVWRKRERRFYAQYSAKSDKKMNERYLSSINKSNTLKCSLIQFNLINYFITYFLFKVKINTYKKIYK